MPFILLLTLQGAYFHTGTAWRRWHSLCGGEPLAAILSGAEVQVPKLRISKRPLGLATAMRQAVKSRSRDLRLARTCTLVHTVLYG